VGLGDSGNLESAEGRRRKLTLLSKESPGTFDFGSGTIGNGCSEAEGEEARLRKMRGKKEKPNRSSQQKLISSFLPPRPDCADDGEVQCSGPSLEY